MRHKPSACLERHERHEQHQRHDDGQGGPREWPRSGSAGAELRNQEGNRGSRGQESVRRAGAGLVRALCLTLAATVLWGIVHIRTGRRATGIALMTVFLGITGAVAAGAAACFGSAYVRGWLLQYAVH